MKNSLHTADLNPGPLKQIFMKQMLFLWASRPRREEAALKTYFSQNEAEIDSYLREKIV